LAQRHGDEIGRRVAAAWTLSTDEVRTRLHARYFAPAVLEDDAEVVGLEMLLSWRGVWGGREAEREAARDARDAVEASVAAEVESRPVLSPDKPLRAVVMGGSWRAFGGGGPVRSRETVDIGARRFPAGRVALLASRGLLLPDPDHPGELAEAVAANTPKRPTAAESAADRQRRLAKERKARQRARERETEEVSA
jgi:hypothetical protein